MTVHDGQVEQLSKDSAVRALAYATPDPAGKPRMIAAGLFLIVLYALAATCFLSGFWILTRTTSRLFQLLQ